MNLHKNPLIIQQSAGAGLVPARLSTRAGQGQGVPLPASWKTGQGQALPLQYRLEFFPYHTLVCGRRGEKPSDVLIAF